MGKKSKWESFSWINLAATLATSVLALTAVITVYITLSAWAEEREASRPYLTLQESPEVSLNENLNIELKFLNVGKHPVENLHSRSLVFSEDLVSSPVHNDSFEVVNEIPQDSSASLLISVDQRDMAPQTPQQKDFAPNYIVISLQYDDPILKKDFQQILYLKWNGVIAGKVQGLVHVQVEEKSLILNYLHNQHLELERT